MNSHSFLIVDDEEMLRELMSEYLGEYLGETSENVFTAQSSNEALEIISQHHIDMMITDIMLANELGTDLYKKIHDLYPDIKVMFVTGYCNINLPQEFPDVPVLKKPFFGDDFIHAVEGILSSSVSES